MLAVRSRVRYHLDRHDRILASDDASLRVVGTRFWDHFGTQAFVTIYRALFGAARRSGRELTVPYQCNDEQFLRHYEMTVAANDEGGVILTHRLIRSVPRTAARARAFRGAIGVFECSVCERLGVGTSWQDLVAAVERDEVLLSEQLPRVWHGVCPACRAQEPSAGI